MAAESNTGGFHFHHDETFGYSALNQNRHAISFHSGAINSTSEMIPMGNYFGMNNSTTGAMVFSGNSSGIISSNNNNSNNQVITQSVNPSASPLLLDSVPGLKHDAGLAVEWSVDEQYKLDEGLHKFADEPSIMKYIKIAATLRDKTVRDVALRCRWLARKRRKSEEHNVGKKVNNRKDKLVESSSKTNLHSAMPLNVAPYTLMMHRRDQNELTPYEVSGISGKTKHLLEQNAQAFNQITDNLSTYKELMQVILPNSWPETKLQDNIDLLCRTRNNITAILNDMRDMPGIMSRMPRLPCINEDLANSFLPNTT